MYKSDVLLASGKTPGSAMIKLNEELNKYLKVLGDNKVIISSNVVVQEEKYLASRSDYQVSIFLIYESKQWVKI